MRHFVVNLVSFGQGTFYVAPQNGLIIRDQPSTAGKRVGKLSFGTEVEVIKQTRKFLTITDGNNKVKGEWVMIKLVYPSEVDYDKDLYVFDFYLQPKNDFIQTTREKLAQYRLTKEYDLCTDNNPFYIKGDFNGDTVEDHIILIREKNKNTEEKLPDGILSLKTKNPIFLLKLF